MAASNIKSPSVDIDPTHIAATIDWLNRNSVDARPGQSMSRNDVLTLQRGDALIMHEATMGVGNDMVERIYAPGTSATFWECVQWAAPEGLTAIVVIGPMDGDQAIVNCFCECDPAGYPFRRATEESRG